MNLKRRMKFKNTKSLYENFTIYIFNILNKNINRKYKWSIFLKKK
jgi:hypothetical protein